MINSISDSPVHISAVHALERRYHGMRQPEHMEIDSCCQRPVAHASGAQLSAHPSSSYATSPVSAATSECRITSALDFKLNHKGEILVKVSAKLRGGTQMILGTLAYQLQH